MPLKVDLKYTTCCIYITDLFWNYEHIVIQKKTPSNYKAMAKHILWKFGSYVQSHAITWPNVTVISHNVLAVWDINMQWIIITENGRFIILLVDWQH